MLGFAIVKQYCATKFLVNKLPNLPWSFKVCNKWKDLAVNRVPYRCASTEIGAQRFTIRLTNRTKGRQLLNVKNTQQKTLIRQYTQEVDLDMKTDVITDVMLYRNEKKYFIIISLFCATYISFWAVSLTYYLYVKAKALKGQSITEIFTNWDVTALSDVFMSLTGPLIFFACWMFIGRTIKYIILRKGGKYVTIVNYHMIKSHSFITVPINEVHCRVASTTQVPTGLNIKGYSGYFLFDSGAEFLNRPLFYNTIAQIKL